MSAADVEFVRHGFELWQAIAEGRADRAAIDEWLAGYAPDARIDFSRTAFEMPADGTVEDMVGWIFGQSRGAFEALSITTDDPFEHRGWVILPVRMRARGISSGAEVEMAFAYAFRVAGGKVIEAVSYPTLDEALAATRPI